MNRPCARCGATFKVIKKANRFCSRTCAWEAVRESRTTMCKNGHSLTDPANVKRKADGRNRCLTCNRQYDRDWHAGRVSLEWYGPRRFNNRAKAFRRRKDGQRRKVTLTESQVRVTQLISNGLSERQVATVLGWSHGGVKGRRSEAHRRMGTVNAPQLVALCLRRGYIQPDRSYRRRTRRLARKYVVRRWVRDELRPMLRGERPARENQRSREVEALLDCRTIPHVVSRLWAVGAITARDVPDLHGLLPRKRPECRTWEERKRAA